MIARMDEGAPVEPPRPTAAAAGPPPHHPPDPEQEREAIAYRRDRLLASLALMFGLALALAVPNQVAIWQRAEPDQVLHWVSHHVFDIGQMLGLGLVCGSVGAWLSKRFRLRRSHALLVIACASLLVGAAELPRHAPVEIELIVQVSL